MSQYPATYCTSSPCCRFLTRRSLACRSPTRRYLTHRSLDRRSFARRFLVRCLLSSIPICQCVPFLTCLRAQPPLLCSLLGTPPPFSSLSHRNTSPPVPPPPLRYAFFNPGPRLRLVYLFLDRAESRCPTSHFLKATHYSSRFFDGLFAVRYF